MSSRDVKTDTSPIVQKFQVFIAIGPKKKGGPGLFNHPMGGEGVEKLIFERNLSIVDSVEQEAQNNESCFALAGPH